MEDIAPQLLELLQKRFNEKIAASPKIRAMRNRIEVGDATYADAGKYAWQIGQALADIFRENLSSDMLPDGRMYYNIADRVLRPLLEEDHAIISEAAAMVQTALNRKANIGIKAQTAPVNRDRIDGLVNLVSESDAFDAISYVLDEPVKNFSMNVVDETLRANVNFQGRSGLNPKVIRRAERKCCEWCSNLAGVYDYPVDREVYQRHERCRCTVEYEPGDGRRQNVHSKQWLSDPEESDMMAKRQVIGLRAGKTTVRDISAHAFQRIQERNVTMDAVKEALEHPLDTSEVKYDAAGRPSVTLTGEKATVSINPETGMIATVYPTHTKTARRLKERK